VLSGPRRRGRRQCPRSVSRDGSALPALLAARLDQLDPPERFVLERGSVEGEVFHHGVVQALTPEEERLTNRLTALVRKELIRAETPLDAAFQGLPKAERAELDRALALCQRKGNLVMAERTRSRSAELTASL
jgi:hypothetical protein